MRILRKLNEGDKIDEPKVVFDGTRAVESNVRTKYIPVWFHPSFECPSVSPIFYCRIKKLMLMLMEMVCPKAIYTL
jgi:hypothetical protein